MEARRIVALASLGLVAVVVIGLIATADGDANDATPAAATVVERRSAEDPASPRVTGPTDTGPTAEGPAAEGPAEEDDTPRTAASAPDVDPLVPELPNRSLHPPLLQIEQWLQSDVTSLEDLRGKVVAVQFWTFGCSNCKATIPHLQELYAKYGRDDFEIVGVHAPEFDYERDPDAIADAALDLGVSWPIALDTEKRTFRSWQTDRRFWPRLYLIDQNGNIRYDKIGEGKYDVIDAAVGALIAEQP